MIGRPFLYGVAALGESGVSKVIELLRRDLDNALVLLGCASVQRLDRSFVVG